MGGGGLFKGNAIVEEKETVHRANLSFGLGNDGRAAELIEYRYYRNSKAQSTV